MKVLAKDHLGMHESMCTLYFFSTAALEIRESASIHTTGYL
jgi:hypothetical protein